MKTTNLALFILGLIGLGLAIYAHEFDFWTGVLLITTIWCLVDFFKEDFRG